MDILPSQSYNGVRTARLLYRLTNAPLQGSGIIRYLRFPSGILALPSVHYFKVIMEEIQILTAGSIHHLKPLRCFCTQSITIYLQCTIAFRRVKAPIQSAMYQAYVGLHLYTCQVCKPIVIITTVQQNLETYETSKQVKPRNMYILKSRKQNYATTKNAPHMTCIRNHIITHVH